MDESNRLQEFRQMKKDIRGSVKHLVVGIDIAKERHNAFFGIASGKTLLRRCVFENTKEGFEKLCFHAEILRKQYMLDKTIFGVEPTADYHKPLGEYLIRKGFMVVFVSGNAVKNNRELLDSRWDKHDTKDAANVADLISQGKCLFYESPSEEIRQIRSLLSLMKKLKKIKQAFTVRIRNHLIAQYFPELDRYWKYAERSVIVQKGLNPRFIAEMSPNDFICLAASKRGTQEQRKRLYEIRQAADSSIGCAHHAAASFEAFVLAEGLREIDTMIHNTALQLEKICSLLPEYTYLVSIPGFGPLISAMVIGAIGNPYRFENAGQVLKTAGLDLSSNRSGKKNTAPYVISKRGKADLRYGLYQAARIASTGNKYFMQYFTGKLTGREHERGVKTKLWVKLSAKMLVIAWTLMKKKEVFNPGYMTI